MQGTIEADLRARTLILTISNESKRNALSRAMTENLQRQLSRADGDDAVAAVVIVGSGDKAFCSGHDLAELIERPDAAFDPVINEPFLLPRKISKPVIAAVGGAAFAGGLNLAMACDIRLASRNATFSATGARLGLLPIGGQLSTLPQLVGAGPALDMLLRSRPVDAERALQIGLVSELAHDGEALLRLALEVADTVAGTPPALNREIKRAVWTTIEDAGEAARRVEIERGEVFGHSPEARARMKKFFGPKTPDRAAVNEQPA